MLAGDREGFEEFFEDLVPRLHRFVASRLKGDPELVKEIVQRSLLIAIDSLERYRGEAALFSWICGICRHEILGHFKRMKYRPADVELIEEAPEIRASLESLSAVVDTPEAELARADLARLVHRALDYLPRRYSRALEWKYCDGLSVKEIAVRLEVGPKAAESTLTRARVAFREAMSQLASSSQPSRSAG